MNRDLQKKLFGNVDPEQYDAATKVVSSIAQRVAKLGAAACQLAGSLMARGAAVVDQEIRRNIQEAREQK